MLRGNARELIWPPSLKNVCFPVESPLEFYGDISENGQPPFQV
jgi:hypothetical protein